MTDRIDRIILQDDADRQRSLNKKTSYAVLSINDALPHYVNHELFDTFMENSLKCQDAIIEKFYRHILDKDEQFKERIRSNNELNVRVINAILDLTKPKNIKEFSYLISLLNNINDFLLGNKGGFGYTTTKFLKNNVNYELLRRFITQDQEDEDENFAKYIYKHFFGFNLSKNEADYYLDNKNKDFINISNTTALSTLVNLVNVYFVSGFIHARMHSRNKFLSTDPDQDDKSSNAKKFVRSPSYANLFLNYDNLLKNKLTLAEKNHYLQHNNIQLIKSFNRTSDNFFITKPSSSFNVYKNIGNPNKNNNYINFDNNSQELIASSRAKDLISLDIAFDQISEPYQMLIKPLISSNTNAALASEWNLNQRNEQLDRSITRSSYYLANKYLYDADNSKPTLFIENVKFSIGQAKTIYSKLYNKKQKYDLFDSFYEKTIKRENIPERELESAVVLSNALPDSLLVRSNESVVKKDNDNLFNQNEIDYFESNNRISSPNKGFDKLNLLNGQDFDEVIALHQDQKDLLESKIDSLFDKNAVSSCTFFEKVLEKSTEGIRKSLSQIQAQDSAYIEYFPSHLLEEISYLIRFNSNKNDSGRPLAKNLSITRENLCKIFYESAIGNPEIDNLSNFYSKNINKNTAIYENLLRENVTNNSKLSLFITGHNTDYVFTGWPTQILVGNERTDVDIAKQAFTNLGLEGTLKSFIKSLCNEKTSEVDFAKLPIDLNKEHQNNVPLKLWTPRYYQTLGHVFSLYYTCANRRNKYLITRNDVTKSKFFYLPFFGFIRGEIENNRFEFSESPFALYPVEENNIFSQMKSNDASNGIIKSFIELLQELLLPLNNSEIAYDEDKKYFIFNLFKSYSQLVLMQLSNLFEYSTLLHIPKMVSEGPLHYYNSLFGVEEYDNNSNLNTSPLRSYRNYRSSYDGLNSDFGGEKSGDYRYPIGNPENDTNQLYYCNVKADFQPSQTNIENYLSTRGIQGYYSSNQDYNSSRLEFNEKYRNLRQRDDQPLNFGFFCKRVNTYNNTLEDRVEGGLASLDTNGNPWFESLKQEVYSYKLLDNFGQIKAWGATTYPYNYPLLGSHNHLLSFYNGFIGFTIDKLLSQMKENYLFEKTELFERDMIYGPLSKIHNAFLAEDLTFTFLLDSVRYGFNHFKEYKKHLESLESDSADLQEKRQVIEENLSKFYTSEEGFVLDEYLSTISKSQKLSLINKFRIDSIERNDYYYKLVNGEKPTINRDTIIKHYKEIRNDISNGKYDKILVVGVGEDLLERSNGEIFVNVYLKDFVYKKKNPLDGRKFNFRVDEFGSTKIINSDSYRSSISDQTFSSDYNILSEKCRDYLAIATGNSLSDSDLFKNSSLESFNNFEGAHYAQETNNILNSNLPEINSFYQELSNFKNDIVSNEGDFFFVQDNFSYSDETDLYLYEKSSKDKIKKDIVKRLALFDYMIFSNDVIGRKCLLREFPRIFYLPINTKEFYPDSDQDSLRLKNLSDISVEVTLA